ncbi:hypothetical protein [Sphingomonas sp. PAMC 26617]|uniref:hypothetical protein n=1 Tax=Sphingomonas sp. PAMC 26617 TaxID=1112216 RepID=UPI00028A0E5B|nr:hypothetical protein [Sphingomonas sp. PAMC 26617]
MATQASQIGVPIERERAFFFAMAIAIVLTTVSGFVLQFVMGRSSIASPWWVHLHGMTSVGWLALYAMQNYLVFHGSLATHRRLGWVASWYLGWMVAVGLSTTTFAAAAHRIPFFFEPNVFLVMDYLTVLMFAGLTLAGVALRARTDWHRRLMLCGAILVMTPGVGRLLPLPLMGTWILWSIWLVMTVYVGIAMTFDVMTRGRIHPAYFWGFGAITLDTALMRPLAFSPPVLALTKALMG